MTNNIPVLPSDVIIHIFSFVPCKTLITVSQVCKEWYSCSNEQCLWKKLFISKFFYLLSSPRFSSPSINWKEEYQDAKIQKFERKTLKLTCEILKSHKSDLRKDFSLNESYQAASEKKSYDRKMKMTIRIIEHIFLHIIKVKGYRKFFKIDTTDEYQFSKEDIQFYHRIKIAFFQSITLPFFFYESHQKNLLSQLQGGSPIVDFFIIDEKYIQRFKFIPHLFNKVIPSAMQHELGITYSISKNKVAIPTNSNADFSDFAEKVFLTMLYYLRHKLEVKNEESLETPTQNSWCALF